MSLESPSQALKWQRVGQSQDSPGGSGSGGKESTWTRRASSVESFLHYAAIENQFEYNIHVPTIIKLRRAVDSGDLKRRIEYAWTRLFVEFPELSVVMRTSEDYQPLDEFEPRNSDVGRASEQRTESQAAPLHRSNDAPLWPLQWIQDARSSILRPLLSSSFSSSLKTWSLLRSASAGREKERNGLSHSIRMHYDAQASQHDLEGWLAATLHFREVSRIPKKASSDTEECLDEVKDSLSNLTTEHIANGIPTTSGHVRLNVVLYDQGWVGLDLCVHHAIFDGTAAYVILDEFLQRLQVTTAELSANLISFPLSKRDPTPHASQSIEAWVFDGDYSSNLRSQMGENVRKTFSPQIVPTDKMAHTGSSRQAMHRFTAEETVRLLAAAKDKDVTISQVAAVCHLVPLARRRPPRKPTKERIYHLTSVNVRNSLRLHERYVGNVFLMPDLSVPASAVVPKAAQTLVLDSDQIIAAARTNGENLQMARENASWLLPMLEYTLQLLLDSGKRSLPATAPSVVSDGLLERYVKATYASVKQDFMAELAFDVYSVALRESIQSSLLSGRTSTFLGRLQLSFDFNDEAWAHEDVQDCVDEWADAIRFVLLK